MSTSDAVVVYGATGHTGRFVVTELLRRGFTPILSGRDANRLTALAKELGEGLAPGSVQASGRVAPGGVEVRAASVDDPEALDRALAGAAAVVNCAGPFAVTGGPVVEAALRAGIPYVDVAAEIEANASMFATYAEQAAQAGTPVVPAMAFYGGLGDLLATAALGALGGSTAADEVHVAYGLSSWHPTEGTRAAGRVSHERRAGRRVRFRNGALEYHDDGLTEQDWAFPEPLGRRAVLAEFTMADVVTVSSHLDVPEVRGYMTVVAARDLSGADTPAPEAADESGRSDQTFVVDVVVHADGVEHRATAAGRDIYAITAPLAVEAVARILAGDFRVKGLASAGAMFDAAGFLRSLEPHLTVELPEPAKAS
ncbi:saccharopine dehydrogenase NADP-binding domain-containing protein [Nonomuraea sp. NPDC048892]|uniref:saccharopine dehydrogenase NADP-binding domain-containing protein n=1 Tax=Nonomuraea sp. NPDC048892 TaxID=3154624 RepID=UPI0033D4CAA5